jgi:hypothetical protein
LTGPLHDYFPALAGSVAFVRNFGWVPAHGGDVSIIP